MERIEIPASNNTPRIIMDGDASTLVIEGKSFPEDSREFYRPVMEWLEALRASHPLTVKIHFNFFYLSSSSVISVKQFLKKAIDMRDSGSDVTIEWAYDEDDEDIKKTGEDYERITKLKFEYKINY